MFSALQNRIQEYPEELLPVFREFHQSYEMVKRLRNVDMKLAMTTLDILLHKVHCLQRIPIKSVPISLDLWSKHLARIYNNCQKEKSNIQEAFVKWSALELSITHHDMMPEQQTDALLSPWIDDWNDDTLQTKPIKRLVRDIVVPILYSESMFVHNNVDARSRILVVAGPSNVGKSYAVRSIHNYLRKRNQPLQWVNLSVYDCPQYAKTVLDEERISGASTKLNPKEWTVMVTDSVSSNTLIQWSNEAWCVAWDRHLRRSPKTLWVVLETTSPECEIIQPIRQGLFTVEYTFTHPDSKTVYHYIKKRIYQHYSSNNLPDNKPFPEFAQLPIVEQLPQLAHFVVNYVKQKKPDFEQVEQLFYDAIQYCEECSLNDNGLFGIASTLHTHTTTDKFKYDTASTATPASVIRWYPKNSVDTTKLPKSYDYKLLNHSKHDCLEWCPQTVNGDHDKCIDKVVTYWNIQLFDTLTFCEYDKFTHIYIDPNSISDESETYSIITTFPIQSHIFPYHLEHDLEQCYEWTISFGCGISNYMLQSRGDKYSPTNTTTHRTFQDANAYVHSTTDALSLTDSQCAEVYNDIYPNKLHFTNVTSSSQVWYIERKEVSATPHPETPCFHLSYKDKHSSKITEFINGVPYNVSATVLQKLIAVLLDSNTSQPSNIVQVQTHSGYAYYIDFNVELEQSFHITNIDRLCKTKIYPQIALPVLQSEFELDENYRLTTESDVNALIEKYPRDYKDIYVDDEATWKLKPIRKPEHIDFLNGKYTKEQKCYLTLFSDLLRAKVAHYACLTSSQRITLDETLVDLQNQLDYILQIIPETDHAGKWNEVWSMNVEHPQFEYYHPPEHDEVDKVISVKLATAWLRHDASFTVSPVWLKTVSLLCSLYNDSKTETKKTQTLASPPLCYIAKTWKIYHQQSTQNDTQWIYVKSTVSHTFWKQAKDTSRLFAHVQDTLQKKKMNYTTFNHYNQQIRKHSLFFEVFRNAEHIGFHNNENNHIHWNTFLPFSTDDPIYPTLQTLHKEPKLWMLMFKHYPSMYSQWLFSLYQLGQQDITYANFYAHLFYPSSIHYWSLQAHTTKNNNIFEDIQKQKNIDTFVRQYAFVHNQIHKKQFVLNGELPGKYIRKAVQNNETVSIAPTLSQKEKQVMTNEDKAHIHLYGLDLHHLTDSLNLNT